MSSPIEAVFPPRPLSERALAIKAYELRVTALDMIYRAQSGHPASAFSIAEIISVLYYHVLHIRPEDPLWPARDRMVLSKGHASSILYAALSDLGYFPANDLLSFRQFDSHLQGHPKLGTPGVDVSTGPLGLGASVATGIALAGIRTGYRVYAILGDGELNCGLIWETALFAAHNGLSNLTFVVDRNMLQYTGPTESVLAIEPLAEKWSAFGWDVHKVDGHSITSLLNALGSPKTNKPQILIAATIKGKGVSFMENSTDWHGSAPSQQQYELARTELLSKGALK